jgi:cell wall-associated NlpC family hydrolase
VRVEVTFDGDSHEAVNATELVTKVLGLLHTEADRTGHALTDVRITTGQATESDRNARRIAQSVEQIGQEARKSRRELEQLKLASAGSGGGFGGLLPGGARPRTAAIGLLGLLGAAGSGPAAGGAAALGVGALSFAGPAAASIGVLIAAFHGLGDAIGGDRQAFEKLSPATQTFVQDVRSLIPWLHELQGIAREGLLPGVAEGLHAALNPQTAAGIQDAVRGISNELGKLAAEAGHGLGGPQFQTFLDDLGTHGVTQLDDLGHAAGHLASALLTLDHAGQPVADWLARVTDDGARFVDEWLKAADASGALGDKLGGAQHELTLIGHLVAALGDAALHLADDLTPLGNQIIVDLTNVLQDLAHWLDKNHDKVVEITTGALAGLEQIVRILAPLVATLAKDLAKVADAVGGWDQAFEIILGGVLLKALLGIGKAAGEKGAAGKVGLLSTRLKGLNALTIAPIVIPIALAVSDKQKSWMKKHFGKAGAALFDGIFTAAGGGIIGGPQAVWDDLFGSGSGGSPSSPGSPKGGADFKSANLNPEAPVNLSAGRAKLLAFAKSALGKPYLWGGSGPNAFDCSGLVMWAFAQEGIQLPHFSGSQFNAGTPVARANLQPGDVVFTEFDKKGVPQHEGMYVGGGKVIQAPHTGDVVKTTSLDAFIAGGKYAFRNFVGDTGTNPWRKPPAFSGDKGGNILPAALRKAMAIAQTTPGTRDDKASIQAAVKWLRGTVGGLTGEDQINAYLELASLLGQLKSLAPKVKKGPAMASKAALISDRALAAHAVGLLTGDPAKDAIAAPESLEQAEKHLAAVRAKLGPSIRQLKEALSHPVTAKEAAAMRAQLSQYTKQLDAGMKGVAAAFERRRTEFQTAWQKIADDAITGLEKQRASYKSPARILLEQLTATHDTKALNDALDQANADLATALKGHQADAQSQLDQIKQYVGTAFLTNALDAAQSAILGGNSVQMSGAEILSHLQGILAGGNVVDPDEVKRAQQAVEDAKYAIQVAGLEKTATAEEEAYNASIDAQEQAIQQMAANWATYFANLGGDINAIASLWNQFFSSIGSGIQTAGAGWTGPVDSNGVPLSAGFNGFDANGNWIGGDINTIPSFDVGGPVGRDMVAQLHAGEHVVPRGGTLVKSGGSADAMHIHLSVDEEGFGQYIEAQVVAAAPATSRRIGVLANQRQRAGRY